MCIEGSMGVISQGTSAWRSREKEIESGKIRNRILRELSVWRKREKEKKAGDVTNRTKAYRDKRFFSSNFINGQTRG